MPTMRRCCPAGSHLPRRRVRRPRARWRSRQGRDRAARLRRRREGQGYPRRRAPRRRHRRPDRLVEDRRARFKTTIRNAHDSRSSCDRGSAPGERDEEIQVEMLPASTQPTTRDLRDRRGVMEWAFESKPAKPARSSSAGGCAGRARSPSCSRLSGRGCGSYPTVIASQRVRPKAGPMTGFAKQSSVSEAWKKVRIAKKAHFSAFVCADAALCSQ